MNTNWKLIDWKLGCLLPEMFSNHAFPILFISLVFTSVSKFTKPQQHTTDLQYFPKELFALLFPEITASQTLYDISFLFLSFPGCRVCLGRVCMAGPLPWYTQSEGADSSGSFFNFLPLFPFPHHFLLNLGVAEEDWRLCKRLWKCIIRK